MNESPVAWAKHGMISRLIARAFRPTSPPVLVLTLPRSGSSWVGSMLGSAPDALYLREPLTQSDEQINHRITFRPEDYPEIEQIMAKLADKAFAGLPDFAAKVVEMPEQWDLVKRRGRRVVIKELNPRACHWFLDRYAPRVIFLLRHPAAVAWSSVRQAWLGPTPEDWETRGRENAESLRMARDVLQDYHANLTVTYESLCRDPIAGFQKLYAFAGLTWTTDIAELIGRESRESVEKIDAWRTGANPENVAALRRGWETIPLGWYDQESDWSIGTIRHDDGHAAVRQSARPGSTVKSSKNV
jgi:Sulfotransferase domain